ncbi:MAG: hypothetical protein AAFO51_09400, partial [Pseudomonadota bacterium]
AQGTIPGRCTGNRPSVYVVMAVAMRRRHVLARPFSTVVSRHHRRVFADGQAGVVLASRPVRF